MVRNGVHKIEEIGNTVQKMPVTQQMIKDEIHNMSREVSRKVRETREEFKAEVQRILREEFDKIRNVLKCDKEEILKFYRG